LGQIVGAYADSSFLDHGFVYSGGKYTTLDDPNGSNTILTGINDFGQIVGTYIDGGGNTLGFLYSRGAFVTLKYPNSQSFIPVDINDKGQVLGIANLSNGRIDAIYAAGKFTTVYKQNCCGNKYLFTGLNSVGQFVGYQYAVGRGAPTTLLSTRKATSTNSASLINWMKLTGTQLTILV
jgi:hypothetical protein